jgi:hypothetical protein
MSKKLVSFEGLEQRLAMTAELAGIDVRGSEWVDSSWVSVPNTAADYSTSAKMGIDQIRIRLTEAVAAGDATGDNNFFNLYAPFGSKFEKLGTSLTIADNGLSVVWNLGRPLGAEFVAIWIGNRALRDAD